MPLCTDTVEAYIVLHVAFVRKSFSIMHECAQSFLLQTAHRRILLHAVGR